MKDEVFKMGIRVFAVICILIILFMGLYFYNENTYINGQIIGKHTRGYQDEIHYFTVSGEEKVLDIKVSSSQYNRYPLFSEVYIDYNILKEAVSINMNQKEE